MRNANNDNEPTWTHISTAIEMVLTQIYETKYCDAREHQQADSNSEEGDDNGKNADRARVVIENKKRSSL